MKTLLRKASQAPEIRPTSVHLLAEDRFGAKRPLVPGLDFAFVRLDCSNVCSNKRNVKKEGKEEGERLFQGLMGLLRSNFPQSEIENETQYRRYFFDKYGGDWFVDVAVSNSGTVIGASLYSYSREANLVMYNIVAVEKGSRQQGVASALVARMIECSNKRAKEHGRHGIDYVIGEIERPDPALEGEEARLCNSIRPAFHDYTSHIRAIRLQSGEPLIYLLPIMASAAERQAAEDAGEAMESEPLMFCLRPVSGKEAEGIQSREAARLLVWFYKDYLEAECSDVRRDEVNRLLSQSLSSLSPGVEASVFESLLEQGKAGRQQLLMLVPEERLSFMKISDC